MKHNGKTIDKKPFSVKTLDKTALKSRSYDTMRTSFAIEGIRFSEEKFNSLRSRHLGK